MDWWIASTGMFASSSPSDSGDARGTMHGNGDCFRRESIVVGGRSKALEDDGKVEEESCSFLAV